ncbi:ubiquitin carboxyl-terminal hydrolase 8-like isoform X2 [Hibiscus syriacus]|uniref:ubiquitin carboxyl-terminal hydrolase 8-like isoform X2 n=1 Tax=Hibiscus syriacus TaxID=106335 RepID=UPI0019209301|nr:ubiquitin carboxyl-terminal hydrolase 8-like isoform X2 [Hibiscus syriacus]
MNGIKETLNFPIIIAKTTTRLLSLKLASLSSSSLRLFKAVLWKAARAVVFLSMDDIFSSEDDDHLFDLDYHPYARKRPLSSRLDCDEYDEPDDDETNRNKLYLVPYRWWREAQRSVFDQIGGILYTVSSNHGSGDSEIVLDLRKEESFTSRDKVEGVSGREYALVNEALWLRTLKWHNDSKTSIEDATYSHVSEVQSQELFPLQIRLSFSPETNLLLVKISLKDNAVDLYRRACIIFSSQSEPLQIWDFSGQTSQFLTNERINLPNISPRKPGKEVLLELNVHGFFVSTKESNERLAEWSKTENSPGKSRVKINKSSNSLSSYSTPDGASLFGSSYRGIGLLGLTGLQNLGNTCFMNSAIQCLVHTPQLVDYFLGDYRKDINHENPLGMNGELVLAFGELLRKLWAPGATPVAPRMFKFKLSKFAPQFSGYNQHDSQEFLAFLLDGLHEDLNRVKHKPYIEAKDAEACPDKEVADEYWQNHLARNDSIIVDVCQGQYRSTLVCPVCKKVSVTFDPFMYLTLPLPSTTMRTMTVTVFSTDGIALPIPFTFTVPKCGRLKDLLDKLSVACSLRSDEILLVAEMYKNQIFRLLDDPSDSLALIRDDDRLVAYRLPKVSETYPLVVFSHQQLERLNSFGVMASNWKPFGVPLVSRMQNLSSGFEIRNQFLKLLSPFLISVEDTLNDYDGDEIGNTVSETSKMEDIISPLVSDSDTGSDSVAENDFHLNTDFKFYLVDKMDPVEIKMNDPVQVSRFTKQLDVSVHWPDKMIEKYDTCLLSSLPEVFKTQLFTRRPQESISLYRCLEGFLQEEPLGPDDMWYCPRCKKPQQANKKLDLWRLPEILVIHLKRFSYSRFFKNKLETYVDFPIHDLDLSNYISPTDGQFSNRYQLYAISNHYGGMGGGHYTAFVDLGHGRWYEFDDDRVFPVSEDRIKTSAAYVLFYRRVKEV